MQRLRILRFLIGIVVALSSAITAQEAGPPTSPPPPAPSISAEVGVTAAIAPSETSETAASKRDKADKVAEGAASGESPPAVSVEMLERIADQLSLRMRSLKQRESALDAREDSLLKREQVLRERESNLGEMEGLIRQREAILKRREQLPPPQTWIGPPAPEIYGQYAAVLDGQTMQFYHKKRADERVPIASTQKLLTALVVCQNKDLDGIAEVPKEVLQVEPTVVGVQPGERYSRRQLLTALLVKSGNDIAVVLAIDCAGSIPAFAEKMNAYAESIGMTDSHFVNPHGLPVQDQYSTARDIAIAAFEAYQNPDLRAIISKQTYDFVFNDGRVMTLHNTNRLLGQMEGVNGMKTGFTFAAGNCLVCSTSVGGKDRISVVLKSARPQVQEDSRALLTWALDLQMKGPVKK